MNINELIDRWNSDEGKPYKGDLIDMEAYNASPESLGCMCAQGQVLHTLGGWAPEKLRDTRQSIADRETARLLNISIAHAVLLRNVNDTIDGAPAIVLTHPERVLGDQAQTILAFWIHLDAMDEYQWVAAYQWDAARVAAGAAEAAAAGTAAWGARWPHAIAAGWTGAHDASWSAAQAAAGASNEIQGAAIMRERGQPFFFLSLFGFATPEDIPALPENYGRVGA